MPVIKDSRGEDWDIVYNPKLNVFTLNPLGTSSRKSQTFATKPDVAEESPELTGELQKILKNYNWAGEGATIADLMLAFVAAGWSHNGTQPTSEHNTVEDRTPTGERWRAEYGQKYFLVNTAGQVKHGVDMPSRRDKSGLRWQAGNYFKTEAQALAVAEAIKEILVWIHAEPLEPMDEDRQTFLNLDTVLYEARKAVQGDSA